ncbi:ABC transporter permease subunit/CPBP intramembrane protease [Thalassoglobus sp. JC818]|uniref:ABC transporter permease subunit/CPBP intramembrane protease n=1 Tax=Thalassoglobus sp. JC818 TaxID=3232136 RepID=UPI0034596E4B
MHESPFWFAVRQQLEFIQKELRETLRDRRTIITLLAMPLLLYPLLGLGFRFLAIQQSTRAEQVYRFGLSTDTEARWLMKALKSVKDLDDSEGDASEPEIEVLLPSDDETFDLKSAVIHSVVDLGVSVDFLESSESNSAIPTQASVTVYQNRGSPLSRDAADYLEKKLAAANIEMIKNWAKQNLQQFTTPITQSLVKLEPHETSSGILGLLPLALLLMTVTGGVYPAIDLTAGERERNTLETLMALPVPRFRLLLAKYVAVVTVTLLTGLMNLTAMSVTLYALQLDKTLLGDSGLTLVLLGTLFLVLSAFALFYSAVLLLLTSSAKSFKEAQAYLIPLLLLSIAPGLVIAMPGWRVSNATAAIPLVNMLLLAKEVLEGTAPLLPALVSIISTVLYAIAALALAAQVFGNDAVAIGSRGNWQDLVQRPKSAKATPSVAAALITLAGLFPAYFVISGILSRVSEVAPSVRLIYSAALTALLFVGLPSLILWHQKISFRSGLQLKKPSWIFLAAAMLLGLSTWPLVFELVLLTQRLGIRGIDPSQIENVEQLLAGWETVPTWLIILTMGVVPGICEECFFRGYLFSGLRHHFQAFGTILITAVAFGLFHVVLAGGAAPERLLPSTLMGILLGWMRWRSGSLIPSILLHVVHNSTLMIVVQARDSLSQWNIGQSTTQSLPKTWLILSIICFLIGTALVQFSQRKQPLVEEG